MYYLIKISGKDKPGITFSAMEILESFNQTIVDMGQNVTHGLLSLSILVENDDSSSKAIQELMIVSHNKKFTVEFDFLNKKKTNLKKGKKYFNITCLSSNPLPASFIKNLSNILSTHQLNIERIDNPSDNFKCLEFTVKLKNGHLNEVKSKLIKLGDQYNIDIALQDNESLSSNHRLIVFDMDSTLIKQEVIELLAKEAGSLSKVSKITKQAMEGKLDFTQSLNKRVATLKGLSTSKIDSIIKQIEFNPGVKSLIKNLKKKGYKTAVISGGFTPFAKYVQETLKLDYSFANHLEIKNNKLTGKVTGTIVNSLQKKIILEQLAKKENIMLSQVIAIGDGANDIPMLSSAGLGIAFHAKAIVNQNSKVQLKHSSMDNLIKLLNL